MDVGNTLKIEQKVLSSAFTEKCEVISEGFQAQAGVNIGAFGPAFSEILWQGLFENFDRYKLDMGIGFHYGKHQLKRDPAAFVANGMSNERIFNFYQMGSSADLNEYALNLKFQIGKAWYFGGAADFGFNTFKSSYGDEVVKGNGWFVNPNFIFGNRLGLYNRKGKYPKIFCKMFAEVGGKGNNFSNLIWKSGDKKMDDFTTVKMSGSNVMILTCFGIEMYFEK